MPNWCENELTIFGKPSAVREVLVAIAPAPDGDGEATLGHISFNKIIPYPEEYELADQASEEARARGDELKDAFNHGGYEWCTRHWGTKWDACEQGDVAPGSLDGVRRADLSFSTAWTPPLPVIRELGRRFPGVRFRLKYWEGGLGYRGDLTVVGGEDKKYVHDRYRGSRGG
jgi:hypothetical protein